MTPQLAHSQSIDLLIPRNPSKFFNLLQIFPLRYSNEIQEYKKVLCLNSVFIVVLSYALTNALTPFI